MDRIYFEIMNSLCVVLCLRAKSQRAKLHAEKSLQSGKHRSAAHHHQVGRNQRAALRGLRIQSSQLSRICT